ncbi:hypothetical protein CLHOM_18020 [Clostridium homopropionicum DSM 5847]|uniref:Uncharacterized protein n=1 Tax=Clostridium homopropionicum DSM 5847 TaxID=1121318 RepID=A0A0L6ZAB9_9CLOT|nr:hypothetical protein [Clostridium homopropionicum]KOA19713.1 hypothetical protein CLHOM_18020 [Clostridium homopropionicum DSM 5847]SFF79327.1 hypothetical protein SAMN04488501_102192 [Clostridium homopropionicum]
MKKKQIAIITLFTIIITYLAVYFQWAEFYEGYGYSESNFSFSIIFLFVWGTFSYYWGKTQEKKYLRFIIVYWGIGIIASILIWIFANNQLIQSFLFPFYIWYGIPLYGFRYIPFLLCRLSIDIPSLILITSPLGILCSLLGYWLGCQLSKLIKS